MKVPHWMQTNGEAVKLAERAREESAAPQVAIAGSIALTTFASGQISGYPHCPEAGSWFAGQAKIQGRGRGRYSGTGSNFS